MESSIIYLALALIFLISFTSISNACKETMIISSRLALSPSIYGNSPDVYGDRIVWRKEYWAGDNCSSDIYMYNISTNETTCITNNASDHAIYDDKIVYVGSSNDPEDQEDNYIYLYNLSA